MFPFVWLDLDAPKVVDLTQYLFNLVVAELADSSKLLGQSVSRCLDRTINKSAMCFDREYKGRRSLEHFESPEHLYFYQNTRRAVITAVTSLLRSAASTSVWLSYALM
jgi:hypothetical protein